MKNETTWLRPWMIGTASLLILSGIAWAVIPSARLASVRLSGAASSGTAGTAANPTLWSDTATQPNLRFGDGTADRYVPECSPTTAGDVCAWNGTNWARSAGVGGSITWPLQNTTATDTFNYGGTDTQAAYSFDTTNAISTNNLVNIRSAGVLYGQIKVAGTGIQINSGANASLLLNDSVAAQLSYNTGSFYQASGILHVAQSPTSDGASAKAYEFTTGNVFATAGASVVGVRSQTAGGEIYIATATGSGGAYCAIAEDLATGTAATVNKVVVWSGTKNVTLPAATAGLSTIAGVALATVGAAAGVKVCKRGRVYTSCTGAVAAGDLLVTDNTTAGNVKTNNAATAGTIVGRATEACGGTTAGLVLADLTL